MYQLIVLILRKRTEKNAGCTVFLKSPLAWKKHVYAMRFCFTANNLYLTKGAGSVKVNSTGETAFIQESCSG